MNTCFPLGGSGIWPCARQRVSMWQPPIKTLGTESLVSFPGGQHLKCCHNSLLGELSTSYLMPLGEDSWKLVPGFLWSLPQALSPCAEFALYPFVVINHNHQYNYMLSLWLTPPTKSPNLGVVLRTSNTHHDKQIYIVFFVHIYLGPPEAEKFFESWRKCPLTPRVVSFPSILGVWLSLEPLLMCSILFNV